MTTPTDEVLWTPAQATAWLLEQVGSGRADWDGMCLALTSQAYGYGGSGINSASDYWAQSWHRHPGDRNVPAGGLACFTGGSGGYGHIMTALDGLGSFASNDIGAQGQVDVCTIADIERAWGLPYQGWAEPCYWAGWGINPYGPPQPTEEDDMTPAESESLSECRRLLAILVGNGTPLGVEQTIPAQMVLSELRENLSECRRLLAILVGNGTPIPPEKTIAQQLA